MSPKNQPRPRPHRSNKSIKRRSSALQHHQEEHHQNLSRRKNFNHDVSSEESRSSRSRSSSSSSSSSSDSATKSTIPRKKKPRQDFCGGGPSRSIMGWNLFVTGLPANINGDKVQDYFGVHGRVQSIRVIRGRWNKAPSAIVEFANQQDAQNALNKSHHGAFGDGAVLSVTWAFVHPPLSLSLSTGKIQEDRV